MHYRLIDHRISSFNNTFLLDLYELTNHEPGFIYGCVPNGELGITIVLSGESYLQAGGKWIRQPEASVYGLIQRRQFVRMSPDFREINIGFLPHVFQLFMKHSMDSLVKNDATELSCLFDTYEIEKLTAGIRKSANDSEMLLHIEAFLRNHLHMDKFDRRLPAAYDLIYRSRIRSVAELSKTLNLSTAGLRNIFREKVGLSPKDVIKIARIKKALHHKSDSEETLTQLAYELEYFDQSHFIHEFQSAIGLSPRQYFKNNDLTFDFYNFARWRLSSFAENSLTS